MDDADEREYARVMEREEWLSRATMPELTTMRGRWTGEDADALEEQIEYRRHNPHLE